MNNAELPVCKCELSDYQEPRVECFRKAYLENEKIRNCEAVVSESDMIMCQSWTNIADIRITLPKHKNCILDLYEELIHQTFMENYVKNHPRFARECHSANFRARTEVLKQL